MTTAHRPTFNPARGGTARGEGDLSKLSQQYSSKDMPSHLKLKYRQSGQGNEEDIRRKDLRRELDDQEREAARERKARESASGSKKPRLDEISQGAAVDADDPSCKVDSSSDESDSDEDDTAALMAELERIKKERAAEKAEKEAEEEERQEQVRLENILHANPLLNVGASDNESANFKVKRRWDDDVVFRNCAKGLDERKKDATFINDAIRSEFHKKFMEKYVK